MDRSITSALRLTLIFFVMVVILPQRNPMSRSGYFGNPWAEPGVVDLMTEITIVSGNEITN